MASYRYEALDGDGRSRYGSIEALTPRAARDALRAQGLAPVDIEAGRETSSSSSSSSSSAQRWHAGLRADEVSLITRQLATLLASGTPLEQSLAAVAQQADRAVVRKTLERVRTGVV